MLVRTFVSLAAFALITASATAQSFNVDIGTSVATGGGFGAPTNAFGGAASQVGFWNNMIGAVTTNMVLNNLAGAATGVTLTRSSAAGGDFGFANVGATGDFGLLMNDGQDLGATTGFVSYTFSGLVNGSYTVYTYAWAPDVPATDHTLVQVTGAVEPQQNIGGNLVAANTFTLGITHALHHVNVANGQIVVQVDGATGSFGTLNGFQIVLVPTPGALALFGLAGLAGRGRRRV
jgi:hypothetical protein